MCLLLGFYKESRRVRYKGVDIVVRVSCSRVFISVVGYFFCYLFSSLIFFFLYSEVELWCDFFIFVFLM